MMSQLELIKRETINFANKAEEDHLQNQKEDQESLWFD